MPSVEVEPHFPSASFVFACGADAPADAFAGLPVEVGRREVRAPFDAAVVEQTTAAFRLAGWDVRGTATAREVFRFLQRRAAAGPTWPLDLSLPDDLYPFQRLAVEWILVQRQAGLFMDMGLGKTRCVLHAAEHLGAHTLVVAPKSTLAVTWQAQIEQWLHRVRRSADAVDGVFLMRGDRKRKQAALEEFKDWTRGSARPGFLLTNYETLLRFGPALARSGARMIVLDESTYIKTPNAQRTKAAQKLSASFPLRIILTGQPMTQGPEDLFAQVRFLDASLLGQRVAEFRDRYLVRKPVAYGSQRFLVTVGYQNLGELAERVYRRCLQLDKRQCLPDLPEKTYQVREVEMAPDQRRAYDDMAERFVARFESSEGDDEEKIARGVLPQIVALQQITSGFTYVVQADGSTRAVRFKRSPKIEELCRLLGEEARSRKVVVWCQFREEVNWAAEALEEVLREGNARPGVGGAGLALRAGGGAGGVSGIRRALVSGIAEASGAPGGTPVVWVDGRVGDEERDARVRAFQTEPAVRVMVAQQASLSHGVTLHAADLTVYVGNAWSLERRLQSEDRVHRIGQKSANCLYVDLVCPGTIDVAVLDALRRKADLSARVTRKQWERLVRGEG